MARKKGTVEPINLIVALIIITGGVVYIFNNPWGIVIASLGLVIEAVRHALKW